MIDKAIEEAIAEVEEGRRMQVLNDTVMLLAGKLCPDSPHVAVINAVRMAQEGMDGACTTSA
jgi:hypothetical protein